MNQQIFQVLTLVSNALIFHCLYKELIMLYKQLNPEITLRFQEIKISVFVSRI